MFGANREYQYQSSLGTVVVVPRPTLNQLTRDSLGKPLTVGREGFWTAYTTILGIQVKDAKERKPDWVVYRLANGILLAASKKVLLASERGKTSQYHQECFITKVADLIVLDKLPANIYPEIDNLTF